jgi:hypothetical protein
VAVGRYVKGRVEAIRQSGFGQQAAGSRRIGGRGGEGGFVAPELKALLISGLMAAIGQGGQQSE